MNITGVIAHEPAGKFHVPYLEVHYFKDGVERVECLYEEDWDDACFQIYSYTAHGQTMAKRQVKECLIRKLEDEK